MILVCLFNYATSLNCYALKLISLVPKSKSFTCKSKKPHSIPPHKQYKYWFPTNENLPEPKYLLSCPANRADQGSQTNKEDRTEGLRNSLCNSPAEEKRKQTKRQLSHRPLIGSLPSSPEETYLRECLYHYDYSVL
jgi:hypothetical protein